MELKRFSLKQTNRLKDDKILSGIDGWYIKDKNTFLNSKNWDEFLDKDFSFDFLTFESPMTKGIRNTKKIQDIHKWIGTYPKAISFPISKKFKEILEQFNLPQHRFYPAILKHKDVDYEYFVFHIIKSDFNNYVKYDKSTFSEWHDIKKAIGTNQYIFKSSEEWKETENKIEKQLSFSKVQFNYKFENLDFLWFPYQYFVISERLKNALETAKITGIKIEEITSISIEIED